MATHAGLFSAGWFIVKPALPRPLIGLGHSTGGNILLRGAQDSTVGSDHLGRDEVVDGKPMPVTQPPEPSAQSETTDAGVAPLVARARRLKPPGIGRKFQSSRLN